MESVNIKKLAQILNLSIATVSKALRDSHDISAETKKKVVALANELNYQPNPNASNLRRQNTKTIAVIVPEIANNYFSLAINGIESIAQEKGYHVLIYLTHEDASKEIAFVRHLHSGRVDGVLISVSNTTSDYSHLYELQKRGLPIVFFDRVCDDFDTVKVSTDDFESAYLATKHLIEQGCKKIAHVNISKNISIGNKRLNGYLQALKDHNFEIVDDLMVEGSNDDNANVSLIKNLLTTQKPDGIFAAVERYAIAGYQACAELGLNIPEQVKIIGFSNLETAAYLNPSLTTITQPAFNIGKEAASVLFKALEKKSYQLKSENIIFQSALIKRNSTNS